uniref:Uncharacterized protein n=1 Tax=Arundo donax TaxID=35708 RepID=A0A0A9BJJ9_ARUDO
MISVSRGLYARLEAAPTASQLRSYRHQMYRRVAVSCDWGRWRGGASRWRRRPKEWKGRERMRAACDGRGWREGVCGGGV